MKRAHQKSMKREKEQKENIVYVLKNYMSLSELTLVGGLWFSNVTKGRLYVGYLTENYSRRI